MGTILTLRTAKGIVRVLDNVNVRSADSLSGDATRSRQVRVRSLSLSLNARLTRRLGPVFTPLIPSTFSKENVQGIDAPPLGRPGQPVEMASICVFLAGEDSSYITGTTIRASSEFSLGCAIFRVRAQTQTAELSSTRRLETLFSRTHCALQSSIVLESRACCDAMGRG